MKKTAMMLLALAMVAPLTIAHEGHVHEAALEAAPHGGTLRDAGPFKAELVVTGDKVRVHVYDKELKPITPTKKTAAGEVQFPKKKLKRVTLQLQGDVYEGTIAGISKVHRYDLHVTLEIGDKKVVADFGIDNI